jgi:hypothetical protein
VDLIKASYTDINIDVNTFMLHRKINTQYSTVLYSAEYILPTMNSGVPNTDSACVLYLMLDMPKSPMRISPVLPLINTETRCDAAMEIEKAG